MNRGDDTPHAVSPRLRVWQFGSASECWNAIISVDGAGYEKKGSDFGAKATDIRLVYPCFNISFNDYIFRLLFQIVLRYNIFCC